MAVPAATRKLIEGSREIRAAFSDLDNVNVCQGARFHSPTPLKTKPYRVGRGVLAQSLHRDGNIWLCGTCADNLAFYVRLQAQTGNDLPWEVRREFGNLIRALGDKPWVEGS